MAAPGSFPISTYKLKIDTTSHLNMSIISLYVLIGRMTGVPDRWERRKEVWTGVPIISIFFSVRTPVPLSFHLLSGVNAWALRTLTDRHTYRQRNPPIRSCPRSSSVNHLSTSHLVNRVWKLRAVYWGDRSFSSQCVSFDRLIKRLLFSYDCWRHPRSQEMTSEMLTAPNTV